MDDDLHPLEAELKRLRPQAPSPDLLGRIERQLAAPAQGVSRLRFPRRGALASAAAVALVTSVALTWRRNPVPLPVEAPPAAAAIPAAPAPVSAAYEPVTAERTIYAAADEGVVTLADGTAAHRVRHRYVDTIVWRDTATNASLRWSVPGEEVRLVPASIH